ncbi:MAG: Gfo/Idh/MocA family oxidoreductase [Spirochaetes bacterium]|nr:Gfo/Idh/MocA family oxidoreductase [Spirochaetota bacterium]
MDRPRIGLIGMGMIGSLHGRVLSTVKEAAFVAASDTNPNLSSLSDQWGVPFYPDYRQMLDRERIDGVIIAVPNKLHFPVAEDCASRKLHILLEKPISDDLETAEKIIEVAYKNDIRLLVAHHRRYNPGLERVKESIRSKEIGDLIGVSILWALHKPEPYFQGPFSWRAKKGGGPIRINLIHEIDMLRYVCGEIKSVYAEVSHIGRGFEVEDTLGITIRLEGDRIATIFFTDSAPSDIGYEANTGENEFFFRYPQNCYIFFGKKKTLKFPSMELLYYEDPVNEGWHDPIIRMGIKVPQENPYEKQIRHFCRVIQGKEEPRCSGEDAALTLRATLAIEESARIRSPITLS